MDREFNRESVWRVGIAQRRLLQWVLAEIAYSQTVFAVWLTAEKLDWQLSIAWEFAAGGVGLCLLIAQFFVAVQAALALKRQLWPLLWFFLLLAFVPGIGLGVVIVLNQMATDVLKQAGLTVGLRGVRPADLEWYRQGDLG